MDPEVAYKNMIDALREFNTLDDMSDQIAAAQELATSVEALDDWLKRGGVLPKAWDHRRTSTSWVAALSQIV